MQNIQCFNIRIVDTLESNRTLLFEDTQIESPHLIYNGQDDKFANLNTSELHFNMLVKTNDEAVFFHLFTGSEVRFKVILEDVTDAQNTVIKWTGFLLPEQFSEPFTHSNFFVEFVATDGIGRLKAENLSPEYYQDNKSVLEVINRCLFRTGLNFPILFAPAIQNAGFEIDYLDLEVNTASYIDEDDKKPVYDILLAVLKSIGCKLFQYKEQWLVVGINRINDVEITFYKYVNSAILKLEYVEDVTIERQIIKKRFLETPLISVVPLLKKMTTTWSAEHSDFLIPEDVIGYYPDNLADDVAFVDVKYWEMVTSKLSSVQTLVPKYSGHSHFSVADELEEAILVLYIEDGKIFGENTPVLVSDLPTNYIQLKDTFFVKGSSDEARFCTLKIEHESKARFTTSSAEIQAKLDDEADYTFNNSFCFAIVRKDYLWQPDADSEIVFSNFYDTSVALEDRVNDFKVSLYQGYLKATLEINKLLLVKDGFYNLRVFSVPSNTLLYSYSLLKSVVFTIEQEEDEKIINERNIQFTTSHNLDVFHSGFEMKTSTKAFSFSTELQNKIIADLVLPLEVLVAPLFYAIEPYYFQGFLLGTKIVVGLSDEDYFKVKNGYKVYIKKNGSSLVELLNEFSISVSDNPAEGGKVLIQLVSDIVTPSEVFIEENDQLYLRTNSDVSQSVNYPEFWLNKWRRNGATESITYLEALNRIYLGCLFEYNFRIAGSFLGFLLPFDLVDFNFKGTRRYNPVILDLNLTEGTTEVTLIESKYKDIAFTEEEEEEEEDPADVTILVPEITLTATVGSPAMFVYNWSINVSYVFVDISPVNTVLKAKQKDANGVYTGFEKTSPITLTSGNAVISFPIVIGDEAGVYELSIEQGGVVSNIEEVSVGAADVALVNINISKESVVDFVAVGFKKYFIDYTTAPIGVVEEYLQEYNVENQSYVGAPIITAISSSLTERTVNFSGTSGTWTVRLKNNGSFSNQLAWLGVV